MATANQNAQGLVLALFNAAAGGNLANLSPFTATASATNTTASELVAVAALVTGVNLSNNATFASTLLSNLQITSSNPAYANALAWVNGQLAAPGADKGVIAGTAVTYLLSLTDSTNPFYTVASTFQNRVNTAVTYSTGTGASVLSASALIAYQASVDNYVAPPPPVVVTALTTSPTDSLVGSGTGTTFSGTESNLASTDTMQPTDKIDGVAGSNVLQVSLGASWSGFTTGSVKNVQTIQLTNLGTSNLTWDGTGSGAVSAYSVTNTTAVISLQNLASGFNSLSVTGSNGTGLSSMSTSFISGAAELSSTTAAIALALNSVGTVSTSSVAKELDLTLNNFATVNITSNGTNYVSFDGTALKTITVGGSGNLTLTHASTSLTTFDASSATGAITANFAGNDGTATSYDPISTIKVGTGGSTITAYAGSIVGNATISAAGGANKLVLGASGAATDQFNMSGFQTVEFQNGANAVTFSGANTTGLTTIVQDGADKSSANITLANMGSGSYAINATSTKASSGLLQGVTLSIDNTGSDTLSLNALAADVTTLTQESETDVYTFSNATGLTVNVNPFINSNTGSITANKATSLTLNVSSGLDATSTEKTIFNETITANALSSFVINASGQLGANAVLSSTTATTGTVTNGVSTGTLTLTTPLLNTLNITSGNALDVHSSNFGALQTLSATVNKGSFNANVAMPFANSITLGGTGATSAATLGNLGTASTNSVAGQGYDLTVNASGLKGGLTIGTIDVSTGNNITVSDPSASGFLTIGNIGSGADSSSHYGSNVTITDNGSSSAFTVGSIIASGTVNINAGGTASATIGSVTGNSVTVNDNGLSGSSVGTITAKALANVTYSNLGSPVISTINLASGATASVVQLAGTLGADAITITSASSTQSSITVSGSLGIGASTTINDSAAGSVAQTVDASGLVSSTVVINFGNSSGNDTIKMAPNGGTVYASWGTDTFTGGSNGANYYYFQLGQSTTAKIDTITNFTKANGDTIQYGGHALSLLTSLSSTTIGSDTLAINANSGITFSGGSASDYATVAQQVNLIHQAAASGIGNAALFSNSGSTYLWIEGKTGASANDFALDTVIKLVGVPMPTSTNTPSVNNGNATSGITGFGS